MGSPDWTRTSNSRLNRAALCQLSYGGLGVAEASLGKVPLHVTTAPTDAHIEWLSETPPSPWDLTPHYVYCLYAADLTPLYVGCSKDLRKRVQRHIRTRPFGGAVAVVDAIKYANRWTAMANEHWAIEAIDPIHNIRRRHLPAV